MKTVRDLAASRLHPGEQQIVREAADALFFCEDLPADPAAREALAEFHALIDSLVTSGRILPETAGALAADVESCGPLLPVA